MRKQVIIVNPRSKLMFVHTAAGNVGDNLGELLSLWFAVSKGWQTKAF